MLTPEHVREFDEHRFLGLARAGPPLAVAAIANTERRRQSHPASLVMNMRMARDAFLAHARHLVICVEIAQPDRTETQRVRRCATPFCPCVPFMCSASLSALRICT